MSKHTTMSLELLITTCFIVKPSNSGIPSSHCLNSGSKSKKKLMTDYISLRIYYYYSLVPGWVDHDLIIVHGVMVFLPSGVAWLH
jgi:hypothetical protein